MPTSSKENEAADHECFENASMVLLPVIVESLSGRFDRGDTCAQGEMAQRPITSKSIKQGPPTCKHLQLVCYWPVVW